MCCQSIDSVFASGYIAAAVKYKRYTDADEISPTGLEQKSTDGPFTVTNVKVVVYDVQRCSKLVFVAGSCINT